MDKNIFQEHIRQEMKWKMLHNTKTATTHGSFNYDIIIHNDKDFLQVFHSSKM